MGRQTRSGERQRRCTLRAVVAPTAFATHAEPARGELTGGEPATITGSGHRAGARTSSRIARYGLRALLVAGAASAAWLLSSQAANAQQSHSDSARPAATHAQDDRTPGLLPSVTSGLGRVTAGLTGSGGQRAAGDKTCDPAGSHDATVRPRTAPVANSTRATSQAAPGAVPTADTKTVAAGGIRDDAADTRPVRPSTAPAATSGADGTRGPGQAGPLAGVSGSVLDPVRAVTRPATEPLRTAVRPIGRVLNQSRPTGVLDGALRPVTMTLADTTRSVAEPLTGPLVAATRPAVGLVADTVHPIRGVVGACTKPLAGVLTGTAGGTASTDPVSSQAAGASGGATPHDLSPSRLVGARDRAYPSGYRAGPGATLAGRPAGAGLPAPAYPEPTPLPAFPASGPSSGGMGSSAAHTAGAELALTSSSVVHDGSAQRVRPGTTSVGLPRLAEVDPVVSPD